MKSLIYYPSFEFTDEEWLKFALLYLGDIKPIIPDSGRVHLSNLFHRIQSETDLINVYQPKYSETEFASNKAMETVDILLRNPGLYTLVFRRNNIDDWKGAELQDYTIFHEKFNSNFYFYCLKNELGHKCDEGLKVNIELAYIYMTILADYIAESNGTSIITDKPLPEAISIIARNSTEVSSQKTTFARSTIELPLPLNLRELSIDQIIEFRNKNGFRQKLNAFHVELDKFYCNSSKDNNSMDFVNSLKTSMTDLWVPISKLCGSLYAFKMAVCSCLSTGNIEWSAAVGAIVTFGVASGPAIELKNYITGSQSKRLGLRYLTDLSSLR